MSLGNHLQRVGNKENAATSKQRMPVPASKRCIWMLLGADGQHEGALQHQHLTQDWSPAHTPPATKAGARRPVLLSYKRPQISVSILVYAE